MVLTQPASSTTNPVSQHMTLSQWSPLIIQRINPLRGCPYISIPGLILSLPIPKHDHSALESEENPHFGAFLPHH